MKSPNLPKKKKNDAPGREICDEEISVGERAGVEIPAKPAAIEMEMPQGNNAGLPAFSGENWPQIIKSLARKLGAAQMLADQAAWAGYDEAAGVLRLAVNGRQGGTLDNRAYAEKIRGVLAEAYGLPDLVLETVSQLPESILETPAMRRGRLQEENRLLAKRLLEEDETCAALMRGLEAEGWKENTLVLADKTR